jgi:hypothetical protein
MNVKEGELSSLGPNAYLDDEYIHLHGRRTIDEVNLLWRTGSMASMPMAQETAA